MLSYWISQVGEARSPILCSMRRILTVSSFSTRNIERPRASVEPSSLRARTSETSASPLVMKRLTPLRCHRPVASSRVARVATAPRSEPASASVRTIAPETSPRAKRGRTRAFVSSSPYSSSERGDLLEAVDGHEAALRPGHHLDHHLVDRLGQVQAAVLPREHGPEELGLAERLDGVLRCRGVGHLAVLVVGALLVRLGGPRGHALAADLAEDLHHDAVVVLGVGVGAGGRRVDVRLRVALLLELQDLAQVELLEAELEVGVVEVEVLAHWAAPSAAARLLRRPRARLLCRLRLVRASVAPHAVASSAERSRRALMIIGTTLVASPTMR